jgi:hypothetical protein
MVKKLAMKDIGSYISSSSELRSCKSPPVLSASNSGEALRGTYEDNCDNREYKHDLSGTNFCQHQTKCGHLRCCVARDDAPYSASAPVLTSF